MKKTYIYGAMAFGLLLTGCKSEDFNPEDRAEVDQVMYVNMNIRGDMADTRAASTNGNPVDSNTDTDFDAGEGESEVNNAYFVFYDNDGNPVGDVVNVTLGSAIINSGTNQVYNSVDRYYQSTVPVSIYKNQKKPTQVVCYINPISPASLQSSLSNIQTVTRDELYTQTSAGGTKYFAMSNSVYYDGTGTTEPSITVPINNDQLFATEAEAKAALEVDGQPDVVNIFVERYAAKLNFKATSATPYTTATVKVGETTETPVTLEFVPKFWAVNAGCHESYVLKSFRHEPEAGVLVPDNYTFSEMNSRINAESVSAPDLENGGTPGVPTYGTILPTTSQWIWNNATFHRSYWSCSPAYFNLKYPRVSSEVDESVNQKYISYKELNDGDYGYSASDESDHYFHETTVGGRALISENPVAAVPSVIYVGDYTIKIGTETLTNTTFYTYLPGANGNPLIFFEADEDSAVGASEVAAGESMLRRFIAQAAGLFKKVGNEYVRFDMSDEDDVKTLVAALEVTFPSDEVKGTMVLSSRLRTLQFKTNANTTGIYVAVGNGYQTIGNAAGNISLVDANKALMQQVGYCARYEESAGYFNIPVKHYGWYRTGNTQKGATKIDWNKVLVGDFGMVRNHSYSVNVSKIVGLATGIGGKTDPIVPPADTQDYYVAYRVNILKWAVLPTQNVEL